MKTTPHDPAFPFEHPADFIMVNGLTKREYFAAMAMQGLLANSHDAFIEKSFDILCEWSVSNADRLIDELNKKST